MGYRTLPQPAIVKLHHLAACDHCGADLQEYVEGYHHVRDLYPRIFVRGESGPDHDDSRDSGEFCSIECARAWLDKVADYWSGWVEARAGKREG